MEINKEPIAIVGIGCRFPGGASSPKAFSNLLRRKKDAIVDVPADRWDLRRFYDENPDKAGKMYVKQGGFLKEKVDRFDPLFFGISPREAESLDPQQRLLLEVTWEAFEDGGLIESELKGSRTGVFVGGFCMDSMLVRFGQLNREIANSHSAASSTMTMLSNRISYTFDLKGPSVAIDTACSSSLVAAHFACQSLWSGESETAIVGGVNVMLRPEFPIVMSKGKFLSPHGRCKAFDEDAAGYARGEGAGVVILKPLSAAQKNGYRIYGLIRETGINQDGRTAGITLPDSDSQETLVRDVYRRAGIAPGDIEYVEAHGTGTQAGDPAEIRALASVLGEGRGERSKCYVGSVKTNIGHLEAGAGVAGLIKAALSLHHQTIFPNLHFKNPNSRIPWNEICIQIPTGIVDWKRSDRVRYAGVNSFGYGGANAHILLQEAPELEAARGVDLPAWDRPLLLPISARSEEAVREIAAKYAFRLAACTDSKSFADFCYTITRRRDHHPRRAAFLASDVDELRTRLQKFSTGDEVEQSATDIADEKSAGKLAFVYTGMGPQWWEMGRELMKSEPVFQEAIEECDALFRELADWSILGELMAEESASRMGKTEVAQPANFVIQVGLTKLWNSWGIKPYSVIGHSVGEVASAYVSGALSLKDAITVSFHRSQLQQSLSGQGAMIAAGLSERKALEAIAPYAGVSIAAINSPHSVTLSGESEQIEKLAQQLEADTLFVRRLNVEVAYHSSQMDPIKEALLEALSSIQPRRAKIPLYSTVVGDRVTGDGMDANYWWHNVRQPVRFLDGIRAHFPEGCTDFLEMGPHPVLGHSIKEIAADASVTVRLTQSLNRKAPEQARMLESLGQLYTQGQSVAWEKVSPPQGELAPLPTYPWQREKYWIESKESLEDRISQRKEVFLNRRISAPQPTWAVEINDKFFPYLKDHVVNGQVVFPGAGYVEAALTVARESIGGESWQLEEISFYSMLLWDENTVQSLYSSYDSHTGAFQLHSRTLDEDEHWQLHASGRVSGIGSISPKTLDLEMLQDSYSSECSTTEMYEILEGRGLQYGTAFRQAQRIWTQDNKVLVSVDGAHPRSVDKSIAPPEILDTAFHSILSIVEGNQPFVPQGIGRITAFESTESIKWIQGSITSRAAEHFYADFRLIDSSGKVVLEIADVLMRRLPRIEEGDRDEINDLLYAPKWVELALESVELEIEGTRVLFLPDEARIGDMESVVRSCGESCIMVSKGDKFTREAGARFHIRDDRDEDYDRLFREFGTSGSIRILYLWSLDIDSKSLDYEGIVSGCLRLMRLAQAIKRSEHIHYAITVVTAGAQSIGLEKDVSGLNASAIGGWGQLIENECENVDCRFVDLDPESDCSELALWMDRFFASADAMPKDLAYRGSKLYAQILDRFALKTGAMDEEEEMLSSEEAFALASTASDDSSSYRFRRMQRTPPGPGEIEIKTHSLCLPSLENGSLDGAVDSKFAARVEAMGMVTRVGESVDNFKEGDRVLGLSCNGVASYDVVRSDCVIRISKSSSCEEYFGYTIALATYYALGEIARLKPGERVLIDGTNQSVSWFAIGVAKRMGAEIFVAIDGSEKEASLTEIGADHVLVDGVDTIAEKIASLTGGEGVKAVLGPSGGRSMKEALKALAPCGYFLEIKTSSDSGEKSFPREVLERNVLVSSIDVERLLVDHPPIIQEIMNEVKVGFTEGWLKSLPVERFSTDEVADAVRCVSDPDRLGNVVLEFDERTVRVLPERVASTSNRKTGTVLITGGNSGFGLETAKWLGRTTDCKIVLLSRRGARSPEAIETIDKLREEGVNVMSESIDVTDLEQLRAFIDCLEKEWPPVSGVIHGAMVLEDAFIQDLDAEKLDKVMAPKVLGAINLYQCVKDRNIDFFISYSSISSLVGNRGQANYVAANAFLDAFSRRLRAMGFPALAINWGALAETGVVARNEIVGQLLEKEGVMGISNRQALSALEKLLPLDVGQVGVFDIDWDKWREFNPSIERSSRFAPLLKESGKLGQAGKAVVLVEVLEGLESPEQLPYLTRLVIGGLSKVLKIPSSKIDPDNSLDNLGIDSLMLIELSLTIQSEFGLNIPAAELPKYPTVKSLASNIQERLDRIRQTLAA